jgi:Domain of unknown function (DUF4249)
MNTKKKTRLLIFTLLLNSCVTQFIPKTNETKELLVVEGLITDQPVANTIKLSSSLPLGIISVAKPVKGCTVTISDDLGNNFSLAETSDGTYVTDTAQFRGIIGRFYTLHINTNFSFNKLNFESYPVEMKPVPPIDSIFYRKVTIKESSNTSGGLEGCQIYLNTHDPTNQCKFYRWKYTETWEFHIPYIFVSNRICWLSDNSDVINIKSTSGLEENRISLYPVNFVSNVTDRLSIKYSILVNQYSLNEDEYFYWEKLQNITEQVGGLYDMIPSAIPSNVYCLEDPNEKVLGYLSVSASSSKRIFIKDHFKGLISPYTTDACIKDTIYEEGPIPYLDAYVWIIISHPIPPPYYMVITDNKECADCTVRGTKTEPDFWNNNK